MIIQAKDTPFFEKIYNEWLYDSSNIDFDHYVKRRYQLVIEKEHNYKRIVYWRTGHGNFIFDSELDYFLTIMRLS